MKEGEGETSYYINTGREKEKVAATQPHPLLYIFASHCLHDDAKALNCVHFHRAIEGRSKNWRVKGDEKAKKNKKTHISESCDSFTSRGTTIFKTSFSSNFLTTTCDNNERPSIEHSI